MDTNISNESSVPASLLSLEKEKRIAAERDVEILTQAFLQLKLLQERYNIFTAADQPTLKRSLSSSSVFINTPLPRAFSQEFYELILHDLPNDIQSTLTVEQMDYSTQELYTVTSDALYSKCIAAIDLNDTKKLNQILTGKEDGTQIIVRYGTQLVSAAIDRGNSSCLKVLLEAGCSPTEGGLQLIPPISSASRNGYTNCLKILLNYKVDINVQDKDGCTPLYLAIENEHDEVINVLLKAKPNLICINKFGNTLLHIAVLVDNSKVLRLLLVELYLSLSEEQFSDIVNKTNNDGYTPLHLSIQKEHMKCVKVLISCSSVKYTSQDQLFAVSNEHCQLLLSTREFKRAEVVISIGQSNVTIGNINVLPHHTWNDIDLLVSGTLEEFNHVLHGQVGVAYKGECTLVSPPPLIGTVSDELLYLLKANTGDIIEEIKTIMSTRQKCISKLSIHNSMKTCTIDGRRDKLPYMELTELEENEKLLEINLELKTGLKWVEFISLFPQDVLSEYCMKLIKEKCLIIHGPPELELHTLVLHLYNCIKHEVVGSIEKIIIPIHQNLSRADLLSILYEKDLLELQGQQCNTTNESYLLVLDGIDKLQNFEILEELRMLTHSSEGIYISDGQPMIKPGKYKLQCQCYVIATRTLFTNRSLPQNIINDYAHIWLSESQEPVMGFMLRHFIRELINARKGELPHNSDFVYQAILWVWQFWLLYNHYMAQLNYFQLTIGPNLFLNCPVNTNNADNIYNWFVELWNYRLVPRIKDTLLNGCNSKSSNNTFKQLIYFLFYRLIYVTCPLPIDATHDFIQALNGSNELNISPVKKNITTTTKERSPKLKRNKSALISNNHLSNGVPKTPSTNDKRKRNPRPKSAGIFSRTSILRKSLFKGSKSSLIEEDDKKNKKEEENDKIKIEDLFNVLMSSDKMDEQRISPPHHVITISPQTTPTATPKTTPNTKIKSHMLTIDQSDLSRPLSADSISKSRTPTHPRVSKLVENHIFPHRRSRSEDNVYTMPTNDNVYTVSTNDNVYCTMSTDNVYTMTDTVPTAEHIPQISTSSDALSTSTDESSTDNLLEESNTKLRSYHSARSLLYSASLGNCTNRKISAPLPPKHKFTLLNYWPEEEEIEM